ncbi:MAG: hypothetical protein DRI22_03510 [Caldiserica bacterium]|nr:MAG: hypothetical protein DRI22_03510 [Caldisericota bacterium]
MLRKESVKAVLLLSGGLDSVLAGKLIKEQGIDIYAFNMITPFCSTKKDCSEHQAVLSAKELGIPIKVISVKEEYIEIIKSPKYGWGSGVNPCIDCRILLLKKAKKFMESIGAKFLITGEVLGQRPKSQHLKALKIIEKEAEVEGLVLRPLSAKCMPPSIPEKEGIVDRGNLLDIKGRGRKKQFELAYRFGLKNYGCPAGGCLLTDPEFSKKVKDAIKHDEFNLENLPFLLTGRHFRLPDGSHLVVGRNEKECEFLIKRSNSKKKILPVGFKGASGIFIKDCSSCCEIAGGIILRYSKMEEGEVEIRYKDKSFKISAKKIPHSRIEELRI